MSQTQESSHFPLGAFIFLFTGPIFSWSIQPLFIRWFADYYDPWTQNAFRYSVAAVAVLGLGYYRGILRFRIPREWWVAIAFVVIANVAQQTFLAWKYEFIYPSVAILVARLDILFICVISFLVFPDERSIIRSPRFIFGALLALFGIVVVLLGRDPEILQHLEVGKLTFWIGVILAVFYALSCASYSVSIKRAMWHMDPLLCFIHVSWISSLIFILCGLVLGDLSDVWTSRPEGEPSLWTDPVTWMFVTGITSIAIAHPFLYAALRRIKTVVYVTLMMMAPFITCSLSAWIYGDRLTGVQIIGGLAAITGAWLAALAQARLARRKRAQGLALGEASQ
ncbi:MAG: DMT family transporter [Candidatus Sumerlaeota bacterium]